MRPKNRTRSNRLVRHLRIRKGLLGDPERPRLSVYRSHKNLQAQIIDDLARKTLLGLSTTSEEFQKASGLKTGGNVEAAKSFGKFVAEKAKSKGIQKVAFDRGGYLYHGRVKAFADAVREGGLVF